MPFSGTQRPVNTKIVTHSLRHVAPFVTPKLRTVHEMAGTWSGNVHIATLTLARKMVTPWHAIERTNEGSTRGSVRGGAR